MSKLSRVDIAKGFVQRLAEVGSGEAVKELAALLLEQRMHGDVEEIIQDIAAEYAQVHGVVEAEARTAFPLSAALKDEIMQRIRQSTGATKVILHEEIDRSLLGGVIVTAPDMELDVSLKSKLAKLKV